MRRSTIAKDGVKNMPRAKRMDSMGIDSSKLKKFCNLWSMNTPREVIQKKLNIGQAQYYRYIDTAEDIVDDFVLGIVDHGLVLQFRDGLLRKQNKVVELSKLADNAIEKLKEIDMNGDLDYVNPLLNIVRTYNQTEKDYNEMLDDVKIVNQTVKTLNKVIANHTKNKD